MADNGTSSYNRFLQGDHAALEELVRAYSDELTRYACLYVRNSAVAEDIMEDTFAALIVKRKKFKGEVSFKAYLYAIVRNKSIDYLRKKEIVPLDDFENVLCTDDDTVAIEKRERDKKVFACMNELPVQYRDVLYFTYFDGYSIAETADIMGKDKKQIYNLLTRARTSLKKILEKEGVYNEDL